MHTQGAPHIRWLKQGFVSKHPLLITGIAHTAAWHRGTAPLPQGTQLEHRRGRTPTGRASTPRSTATPKPWCSVRQAALEALGRQLCQPRAQEHRFEQGWMVC